MDRVVTWDELSQHIQKNSLWVLIEGKVFDVTTYLAEHPGGDDILVKYAGLDATERFLQENHTDYARSLRDARLVGRIEDNPKPEGYDQRVKKTKPKTIEADPNREQLWTEIEKHTNADDLWLVINGGVYDVSDFLDEHPGGKSILLRHGGKDATNGFESNNHSENAKKQMAKYKVGFAKKRSESSGAFVKIAVFLVGLLAAVLYSRLMNDQTN